MLRTEEAATSACYCRCRGSIGRKIIAGGASSRCAAQLQAMNNLRSPLPVSFCALRLDPAGFCQVPGTQTLDTSKLQDSEMARLDPSRELLSWQRGGEVNAERRHARTQAPHRVAAGSPLQQNAQKIPVPVARAEARTMTTCAKKSAGRAAIQALEYRREGFGTSGWRWDGPFKSAALTLVEHNS